MDTTTPETALLRLVTWQITESYIDTGVCALLACGCWNSPCGECSSQWDFPSDVFKCPTHGETQMDLRLQALLYAQADGDDTPIPMEDGR